MVVRTEELTKKLLEISPQGIEVTLRFGILTTTKLVYYKNGLFFLFSIEENISFNKKLGLTPEYFSMYYEKTYWQIDQIIS